MSSTHQYSTHTHTNASPRHDHAKGMPVGDHTKREQQSGELEPSQLPAYIQLYSTECCCVCVIVIVASGGRREPLGLWHHCYMPTHTHTCLHLPPMHRHCHTLYSTSTYHLCMAPSLRATPTPTCAYTYHKMGQLFPCLFVALHTTHLCTGTVIVFVYTTH